MRFLARMSLMIGALAFIVGCSQQPAPSPAGGEAPAGAKKSAAQQQTDRAGKPAQKAALPAAKKPAAKPKPVALKTVQAWEFDKLQQSEWQWTLQEGEFRSWANAGIFYDRQIGGPGPVLENANLDAKTVKAVRVTVRVFKRLGGKEMEEVAPDHLTLYWARKGAEEKLFEKRQGQPMKPIGEAEKKTIFVAPVQHNKDWNGTIDGLFVSVALPKDKLAEGESYRVVIRKIEFLG